jgi:hypothetical protein
MVFLEAWLAGKPLFGRDLPEITLDFKQAGVWYPDLSSSFLIPKACVDLNAVRKSLLTNYRDVLQQFAVPIPSDGELEREFEALVTYDSLDFAILDRSQQADLIVKAGSDQVLTDRLRSLNLPCKSLLNGDLNQQAGLIEANSETILSEFSLVSTGERLRGIYHSLLQAGTEALYSLNRPQAMRDEFLQLARFHPARVNP